MKRVISKDPKKKAEQEASLVRAAKAGASWRDMADLVGYADKATMRKSLKDYHPQIYNALMRARAEAKLDALENMQSGIGGHNVYNWFRLVNNDPYYSDIDKKLDREAEVDSGAIVKNFLSDIENLRAKAVKRQEAENGSENA